MRIIIYINGTNIIHIYNNTETKKKVKLIKKKFQIKNKSIYIGLYSNKKIKAKKC